MTGADLVSRFARTHQRECKTAAFRTPPPPRVVERTGARHNCVPTDGNPVGAWCRTRHSRNPPPHRRRGRGRALAPTPDRRPPCPPPTATATATATATRVTHTQCGGGGDTRDAQAEAPPPQCGSPERRHVAARPRASTRRGGHRRRGRWGCAQPGAATRTRTTGTRCIRCCAASGWWWHRRACEATGGASGTGAGDWQWGR